MTPFQWTLVAAVLVLSSQAISAQSLCDTPQCECDDTQSQVRCSCRKVPQESQVQTSLYEKKKYKKEKYENMAS
jgi:hypothetical protein